MKATTHNGTITMHNPATDGYKVMRIKTQSKSANFAAGERILSVKMGRKFQGIGFIKADEVVLWKKQYNALNLKLADMIFNQDKYSDKVEYLWQGTCRHCNKPLNTPKSIHFGIGPVCFQKYEAHKFRALAEAWQNWTEEATESDYRLLEADSLEIPMSML